MTMSLGSYTFEKDPQYCTPPQKARRCNDIETFGGVSFFSWGLFPAGQEIIMKWPACSTDQYNSFRNLLYDDVQIEWDPDLGDSSAGSPTYYVQIKSLDGDYHMSKKADAAHRKDVELKMIIISEV